jgi:Tol biopolymer transport system component
MLKQQFILLVITLFIAVGCEPESGLNKAVNYELYIDSSADQNPAVSPDGSLIAYYHKNLETQEANEYPTGLYVMDIDGNNRRLLLKGAHWNPSWSPDGNWIVFTSGGTLQIINLTGDSIRTFQGVNDVPLFHPDWSSDGKLILFSSPLENGGFFFSNPTFQNTRQLFDISKLHGTDPNWSPECDQILYSKYYEGNEELFVIDTAGTNDTRLTDNDRTDRHSRWSPDGRLIAWSSSTRIYVMNSDGSDPKKLDYGRYPCWFPDSESIIYSNANEDFSKEVLYRIDIDGSNKIQLTH